MSEMTEPERFEPDPGTTPSQAETRAFRIKNNSRQIKQYIETLEALGYTVTPPEDEKEEKENVGRK